MTDKEKEGVLKYILSDEFMNNLSSFLAESENLPASLVDRILIPICNEFKVSRDGLISGSNIRSLLIPRYLAMTIMHGNYKTLGMTKEEIAQYFNRGKSFRFNIALSTIDWEIQNNKRIKDLYRKINRDLKRK